MMINEVEVLRKSLENAEKMRDSCKYGSSQWHIWNETVQEYQEKLSKATLTNNESLIFTHIRSDFHGM